MDTIAMGRRIAELRRQKGYTQKELAEKLAVTDRAVSRWETGTGCPDVSLLPGLSAALGIHMEDILAGELPGNGEMEGNMKKAKYYVCPACGNFAVCTGDMQTTCCGRPLRALEPQKPDAAHELCIEKVEDEWFLTATHPMGKEHHFAFVAFATGGRIELLRQYPEWNLQVRLPRRGHGLLLWYCTAHGLFCKPL